MPTIANWRPIETAPRDGSPLLLVYEDKVFYGWWFQADSEALQGDPDDITGWYYFCVFNECGERCKLEPTAWAPLPEP